MLTKYDLNINIFLLKKFINNEHCNVIHFEEIYFTGNKLNKYKNLKKMIYDNNFLLCEQKEYLLNIFNKYQKCLFSLKKFIFKYKYDKAKIFNNTYDFVGNDYKNISKNHLITILQNNTKYIFRASDLLNIWKNSLFNCDNMKPNPRKPKNPYSNITFKNHILYNIYFHIKFNTILKIPDIIEKFFKHLFFIKIFEYVEFNTVFNNSVHEYIKNMPSELLFFEIKHMFSKHQIFKKCVLNFSKMSLDMGTKLKKILRYYILYTYIIHPVRKDYYREQFLIKAKLFIKIYKTKLRRFVKVIW